MKIQILRNGVSNIPALEQGISKAVQLCAGVGLTLDINYVDINKTFDSQTLQTDVVNGFGINPQEILNCATGNPDVVCLISTYKKVSPFNFDTSHPINPCSYDLDTTTFNNTLVVEICEEWYAGLPDVLTEFALHELTHCLYDRTLLTDLTHQKYASGLWNQKSNNDYYLYLIKSLIPYLKPSQSVYTPLRATLTRNSDNGTQTTGTLQTGNFKCRTLERPFLNNQRNISCIPKGIYQCKWTFSLRMLKYTYEVQNVPSRSGIRIHSGNFFFDTDGCILLGDSLSDINHDGKTDILNSRKTVQAFEALMNKQPFQMEIK